MHWGNRVILGMIWFYKKAISPFLPASCRFTPTCSEYARQAFTQYHFFYALGLSVHRIIRCHPFNPGGLDPLPQPKSKNLR